MPHSIQEYKWLQEKLPGNSDKMSGWDGGRGGMGAGVGWGQEFTGNGLTFYSDEKAILRLCESPLRSKYSFIFLSFSILVLSWWELVRCLISFSTSERESLLQKPCWNGIRKMFRVPVRKKVNVLEALKGHVLLARVFI